MPVLETWIRRITDNEMPIFGRTVQEVVSVSENDDASAAQLGQVVLKDAAMTSRVLKLANSIYYNPSRQRFSTISRAIMMLGFDTVRSMCLTVALIDSLVQGTHREHLIQEMARSLHAASQAQRIARQRNDPNPEEVFISALLLRIGALAFWCFAGEEGEQLDVALREPGSTPEQAQRSVLGFSLKELSQGLAKEWALSELLQDSLAGKRGDDPRNRNVLLCHQLASAAEQGWDNTEVEALTKQLADLAGQSVGRMEKQLHETAKQAVETSAYYGAKAVARVIPLPAAYRPDFEPEPEPEPAASRSHVPEPDPALQLQILRELTGLLGGPADFNTVIEMALEGLHRGAGLDRVLFALLSPNRTELRPRFALGDADGHLRQALGLHLDSSAGQTVRQVLAGGKALWSHPRAPAEHRQPVSDAFRWAIGSDDLLLAPVNVGAKPIGVFYADRAPSGRSLDADTFESFRHFSQQASLVLTQLTSQR